MSLLPEGNKPNSTNLSEIVEFYNKTKGKVDIFYQLIHRYTVVRNTRRCPLRMFYNRQDSVGINSHIICKDSTALEKNLSNRKNVYEKLAIDLIVPLMSERLQISTFPT